MTVSREEKLARGLELLLLAVLLGFLVLATVRFFAVLERIDFHWTRGLPVAALFAGAGFLTGRRLVRRLRAWRGLDERRGSGQNDD